MKPFISLAFILTVCGCGEKKKESTNESRIDVIILDKDSAKILSAKPPINYDVLCIVGKTYVIYGQKNYDPFRDQEWHRVYIKAKKQGWVQYVYDYDSSNRDAATYTRTVKEFIEQTYKP